LFSLFNEQNLYCFCRRAELFALFNEQNLYCFCRRAKLFALFNEQNLYCFYRRAKLFALFNEQNLYCFCRRAKLFVLFHEQNPSIFAERKSCSFCSAPLLYNRIMKEKVNRKVNKFFYITTYANASRAESRRLFEGVVFAPTKMTGQRCKLAYFERIKPVVRGILR